MPTIELSVTTGYVPKWTYIEAIRELCQNGLDQQIINPDNVFTTEYDVLRHVLSLCSKQAVLTRGSLLLGSSTKADDPTTIGKFGEGYKLALLVLAREGRDVTVFNYAAKERWVAEIVHSDKFDCDVLAVDISKHIFTSVPDNNLTFEINGIEYEEWLAIQDHNLHLRDGYPEHIETPKGNILLEDDERGKVYVGGLFVCQYDDDDMDYGYDIKPEYLQLDRDRQMVRGLDLFWITGQMWTQAEVPIHEYIQTMLQEGASDVQYLKHTYHAPKAPISDYVWSRFAEEYGSNAVPVTSQHEADMVIKQSAASVKPVYVSEAYKHVIVSSPKYVPPKTVANTRKRPEEMLHEIFTKDGRLRKGVTTNGKVAKVIQSAPNWVWKD